jgi:hypothetical protein
MKRKQRTDTDDLDQILETVADAVLHCPHAAVTGLRLSARLELANLIRRDVKRRLLDTSSQSVPWPPPIETKCD